MTITSADHVHTWEVPDWIDPHAHYVYVAWHWREPEEAVYVGVSSGILGRIAQHAAGSLWWAEAGHIDLTLFATRALAEAAERDLIRRLDPTYNVVRPSPTGEAA